MSRTGLSLPAGWNLRSRTLPCFGSEFSVLQDALLSVKSRVDAQLAHLHLSTAPLSPQSREFSRAFNGWQRNHPEVISETQVRQWARDQKLKPFVRIPIDKLNFDGAIM